MGYSYYLLFLLFVYIQYKQNNNNNNIPIICLYTTYKKEEKTTYITYLFKYSTYHWLVMLIFLNKIYGNTIIMIKQFIPISQLSALFKLLKSINILQRKILSELNVDKSCV